MESVSLQIDRNMPNRKNLYGDPNAPVPGFAHQPTPVPAPLPSPRPRFSSATRRRAAALDRRTPAQQRASVKQRFVEFTQETEAHGMARLTSVRSSTVQKLLWAACVVGCVVFLSFYISDRLKYYYQYETQTKISSDHRSTIGFPAVTVCNKNDITVDVLSSLEPDQAKALIFQQIGEAGLQVKDLKYVKKFSEKYHTILQNIFKTGTMSGKDAIDMKLMAETNSYNKTALIRSCKFQGIDCDFDDIAETIVYPYGRCYTINPHEMMLRAERANDVTTATTAATEAPTTPEESSAPNETDHVVKTKPHKVKNKKRIPYITSSPGVELRLVINVDQEGFNHLTFRQMFTTFDAEILAAYFPNNRPGIMVQLHDPTESPDLFLHGKIPFYPADIADIAIIKRVSIVRMEEPYGDCIQREESPLKYFPIYSTHDCLRECALLSIGARDTEFYSENNRTKCLPYDTPPQLLDDLQIPLCNNEMESMATLMDIRWLMMTTGCRDKCPEACEVHLHEFRLMKDKVDATCNSIDDSYDDYLYEMNNEAYQEGSYGSYGSYGVYGDEDGSYGSYDDDFWNDYWGIDGDGANGSYSGSFDDGSFYGEPTSIYTADFSSDLWDTSTNQWDSSTDSWSTSDADPGQSTTTPNAGSYSDVAAPLTGTEETLPPTEDPLSPTEDPLPTTEDPFNPIGTTGDPLPPTDDSFNSADPTGDPLPTTEDPLTPTEDPLPTTEDPLPTTEDPLPTTEDPLPPTEEPFNSTDQPLGPTGDTPPATGDPLPPTEDPPPQTGDSPPPTGDTPPPTEDPFNPTGQSLGPTGDIQSSTGPWDDFGDTPDPTEGSFMPTEDPSFKRRRKKRELDEKTVQTQGGKSARTRRKSRDAAEDKRRVKRNHETSGVPTAPLGDGHGDGCQLDCGTKYEGYCRCVDADIWYELKQVLEANVYNLEPISEDDMCEVMVKIHKKDLDRVQLRVSYDSLREDIIEDVPAYTGSNLLAELGGMMGLFIGISVLSVVHLCEFLILTVMSLFAGRLS